MAKLTVASKGRVTFRKDLLAHLGVGPGAKLMVDKLPAGRIEVRAAASGGKISDVFGLLKQPDGPRLSVEEISQATADGWAGG